MPVSPVIHNFKIHPKTFPYMLIEIFGYASGFETAARNWKFPLMSGFFVLSKDDRDDLGRLQSSSSSIYFVIMASREKERKAIVRQ